MVDLLSFRLIIYRVSLISVHQRYKATYKNYHEGLRDNSLNQCAMRPHVKPPIPGDDDDAKNNKKWRNWKEILAARYSNSYIQTRCNMLLKERRFLDLAAIQEEFDVG